MPRRRGIPENELPIAERADKRGLKPFSAWDPSERRIFARALRRAIVFASPNYQIAFEVLLQRAVLAPEAAGLDRIKMEEWMNALYQKRQKRSDYKLYDSETEGKVLASVAPVATYVNRVKARLEEVQPRFGRDFLFEINKVSYRLDIFGSPRPWWRKKWDFNSVGLLLANAADWFTGQLIQGMLESFRDCGLSLLIEESSDIREEGSSRLMQVAERSLGLLIVPATSHFNLSELPVVEDLYSIVLVDRHMKGLRHTPFVHHNDYIAGRAAAVYLLDHLKCDRIVVVKPTSEKMPTQFISPLMDRLAGCEDEANARGKQVITAPQLQANEKGGYAALEYLNTETEWKLLENDGVFATTDKAAVGCRYYLQSLSNGSGPPVQNLIGVEGQSFGSYLRPQLASLRADNVPLGRLAALVMLDRLGRNLDSSVRPTTTMWPHFVLTPEILLPGSAGERKAQSLKVFLDKDYDRLQREAAAYYTDSTEYKETTANEISVDPADGEPTNHSDI